MARLLQPGQLILQLDGVDKDTVDPLVSLDVASAFFHLVVRAGREDGLTVKLRGLSVEDKCVQFCSKDPTDPAKTEAATVRAVEAFRSEKRPLKEVTLLRQTLSALPGHVEVTAIAGDRRWTLQQPTAPEPRRLMVEAIEVRATILEAGYRQIDAEPRVRLMALSAPQPFLLSATPEDVLALGGRLMSLIDVEARVTVDLDTGRYSSGKLLSFQFVQRDGGTSWEDWFRENAHNILDPEEIDRRRQ